MGLKRDLSQLPAADSAGGLTPDENPRFIQALAILWAAESNDGDKPTALGTRTRHSDAGACARKIAYVAAGIPKSDPMDITGIWNTSLGTLLHDLWQKYLDAWVQTQLPEGATATVEIEPKVGHPDLDSSGHLDAVITITHADGSTKVIVYELKSAGGYAFKAAIGKIRRGTPAEGPKAEHLFQAALNGVTRDADEIVIGYIAKECLSKNVGRGLSDLARFTAEWTLTRDQYEPLAEGEKARLNGILRLLDERHELAARKFPAGLPIGAEIIDPSTGRWEVKKADGTVDSTGTWWACDYCSHQTLCATTEPGRIPVTSVTIAKADAA